MKIAVVTGAGSGIGSAFAAALSEPKYGLDEIWLIDLNDAGLRDTAESITIHARLFCMDIAINEEIESLETELRKIRPNIKMLVNSAGFGLIGWFDKLDMQRQLAMIDVNCKGLTAMTYICIPYMEQGGKNPAYVVWSGADASAPVRRLRGLEILCMEFFPGGRADTETQGDHHVRDLRGPRQHQFLPYSA